MRAAVLGSPIAHSLSPALHNAGYAALGLDDWSYERRELGAGGLAAFLETLDGDWRGLSLTMPLKPECVEAADEVSPLAGRIGVGNTLVRLAGGGWRADNTDVFGMGEALRPGWDDSWREAAVLGAGATARTALFALRGLGVERLDVCARDEAKAA
ncbi:MAG: shikimate dehydrogenase, partial [Propionibacteriaceae bacterium]|nr:shikimate dehydrogenase [Propionibacteriaceae bacterium]